jgi:acetyl esterase/lipase
MKTKKVFKGVFLTVMALIVSLLILCLGFWIIDGRSPQAFLVAHALPQTTMDDYEKGKNDITDKSIVEIPDGVEFPREVKQYKVGGMQVFECSAEDDSKPIVLYIHGGAYVNNFTQPHWKAMAEWAETTGCGIRDDKGYNLAWPRW